jgi:hypothetical protein
MSNNSSDFLPEQQRLLIERIFGELSWGKNASADKTDDPQSMPALCEFFNSAGALPSYEQMSV